MSNTLGKLQNFKIPKTINHQIRAITGPLRTGKTAKLTDWGLKDRTAGYRVVNNYWTSFGEQLKNEELLHFKLENCKLKLDEAETLVDSRLQGDANRYISYVFLQSGKLHMPIDYVTQFFHMVDKRVRDITTHKLTTLPSTKYFAYLVQDRLGNEYVITEPREKMLARVGDKYRTDEVIMPLELSGQVDFNRFVEVTEKNVTKATFITTLKGDYSFLTHEKLGAVYEWIKAGDHDEARRLLGIEVKPKVSS